MTTLLPTLERDLLHAARRTDPASRGLDGDGLPAPRVRVGRRRLAPAALTIVASLTVASGAYAARGIWLPELGARPYGHATATAAAVPSDQLDALGVLRRPQTAADRGPAVRAVLRGAGPRVGAVRTDAVRRLGTLPDGRVAVLVPARVPRGYDPTLPRMGRDRLLLSVYDPTTGQRDGFLDSDALGMRAGNLMIGIRRRLTPSQRSRARKFLDHEVAGGRLRARPEPPHLGVLSVEASARYAAAVGVSDDGPSTFVGVVPDSVRRVQLAGGRPVAVHSNFFVARTPAGSGLPVRWLDDRGRVVRFASTLGAWR